MNVIRIATRDSLLALWQANFVKQKLQEAHSGIEVEIVGMTTLGDQVLDSNRPKMGGKGLFLKELEVSLLNNETDIAVHSMKDVPELLPEGLEVAAVCERADPRDAFVSYEYQSLSELRQGARIGTSSLRRISQLKSAFPGLEFLELRGNVNTRLSKLDDGQYDAIILAAAGLIRLGLEHRIKEFISLELCLPAVGQGIIGIECRSDDEQTKSLLQPLNNDASELFLAAERAMSEGLNGGCQVPVAGFAVMTDDRIRLRGMVGSVDGSRKLHSNMSSATITPDSAALLGHQVAQDLLRQGAGEILDGINSQSQKTSKAKKPVVVLTRQNEYLGNMATTLKKLGYKPMVIEALEIKPIFNNEIANVFSRLDEYTDLVFVSRNAIEVCMSILERQGWSIPNTTRVMAVGSETAKQLRRYKIDALFPNQGVGADALLGVKILRDLTDCKVLIIRGTQGLAWPVEEMRHRGAEVDSADVYRLLTPEGSPKLATELLESQRHIDSLFFHSTQSASNFMPLINRNIERFSDAILVVGSDRIGRSARELGWPYSIKIARSPSNKDMMIAFNAVHSPD